MIAYVTHVVRSKGLANLPARALAIGRNFGLSQARIARKLAALGELTGRRQAPLTACVTACLMERYPAVVEAMSERGWEVAVHGRVHCDLRGLTEEQQAEEMALALGLSRQLRLEACGFRAPYLAWDEATRQAAARAGFLWTSNQALLWPVLERTQFPRSRWEAVERVLAALYRPHFATRSVSVPRLCQGVVEIPVSLPDDEILCDRLRAGEPEVKWAWLRILEESHRLGEAAVLLIHHERAEQLLGPLETVLAARERLAGSVWLVDFNALAKWWLERSSFSFKVNGTPGRWEVEVACSPRGVVLLKEGAGGWREVAERRFLLDCPARPTVGVEEGVGADVVEFLRNEGLMVEPRQGAHGLTLQGPESLPAEAERELLRLVEAAPGALLRFGRWPQGVRSALAISMDVDSITLFDFMRRAWRR